MGYAHHSCGARGLCFGRMRWWWKFANNDSACCEHNRGIGQRRRFALGSSHGVVDDDERHELYKLFRNERRGTIVAADLGDAAPDGNHAASRYAKAASGYVYADGGDRLISNGYVRRSQYA